MRGTWNGLRLAALLVAVAVSPEVAMAASSVTGTVIYTGKPPTLRPLSMDADPVCAKKHSGPVANESLVLGNGGTMGHIMVFVSKGVPAGKTYPVPPTPIVLDQNGCQYKPHVMGIMAGQPYKILNSDALPHNVHTLPKVNKSFNQSMPGTLKEVTTKFDKPEPIFQVKCDVHPWMMRLHRRLHPSVLRGHERRREVHALGPRSGHLRDHRLAREAGDADGNGHGRCQRQEDPGLQVRTTGHEVASTTSRFGDQPHERSRSCRQPHVVDRP